MALHNLVLIIFSLMSASLALRSGISIKILFLLLMPIITLLMYWSKNIKLKLTSIHGFFMSTFFCFYGIHICYLFYNVWFRNTAIVNIPVFVGGLFGGLIALSFYSPKE
jgi:hypothetical protein